MRSASTTAGTPPTSSKHSVSRRSVLSRRSSVARRTHEPVAAPGQDGAEEMQPSLRPPVDHQVLSRHRHPRPVDAPLPPSSSLGLGHGPPEVPRRAAVARRLRHRQQPLGCLAVIRPSVACTRSAITVCTPSVFRGRGSRRPPSGSVAAAAAAPPPV